jgi:hypothetical protein
LTDARNPDTSHSCASAVCLSEGCHVRRLGFD